MKNVRKMIVISPDDGHDAAHDVEDRLAQSEHASRPLLLDRLADAIDDLVLVLEPAQRPAARCEIVDEVGNRVDEAAHLVHERRDDERPMRVRTSSAADEDDARGDQASQSPSLERLHRGVQRRRQQDRDQDPREHVPREVAEKQDDEDDERGDPEHR